MKKTILALAVAMAALTLSSCGSGSASIKTDSDSVAYAIGVDFATGLFTFDSTLNVDVVCAAIKDSFKKKATMTPEEAGNYIRYYMTEGRAKKIAKESATFLEKAASESGVEKSSTGLLYKVAQAGAEPKAAYGDTVSVHYTLTSLDGKVLDSSVERGEPYKYANTETAMIKGFTEGVMMLGKGGKATIWVPAELGYGDQGQGQIGPKQALKFEIEVVDIVKPATVAATAIVPAK